MTKKISKSINACQFSKLSKMEDVSGFEDTLNNFLVGIRHISETFIPGSAPQLKRLFKSFSDDPVLPSGQELSWKTEVAANLTGFRWQKVNQQYVKSALRRKLNNSME